MHVKASSVGVAGHSATANAPWIERASWALYDFANTIFSMNVATLYFSVWLIADLHASSTVYALGNGLSSLLVVVSVPFLGALSDARRRRKSWVVGFTVASCIACALIGVFGQRTLPVAGAETIGGAALPASWAPGIGTFGWVLLAFVVANYTYQAAQPFYNAMMPELAPPAEQGRLSGIGTAVGYVGTIVGLVLIFPFFSGAVPLLGSLPAGVMDSLRAIVPFTSHAGRVSTFVPTAILFLLFSLPLFLFCRDHFPVKEKVAVNWRSALADLMQTLRDTRRHEGVLPFILASFLYQDAIGTIVSFMAIYAVKAMGFQSGTETTLFLVLTIPAIFGSYVAGRMVDRYGARRTLFLSIVCWIILLVAMIVVPTQRAFWGVGLAIGLIFGAVPTAERPLLMSLVPVEEAGRFFSLMLLSSRAAAHVALRWYYADVVVQGDDRVPAGGPLIIVANHPNALVDALLVSTALRRRVLLTAKATLFENPLLGLLLRGIGVVPLRRAADERAAARQRPDGHVAVERNTDSFQQVRAALARGGAVLVFPEGISHDQPALAPLRTGAARMALDAAGRDVRGLHLLPLGLVFERKERPRSRVLVRAGTPLDLDAWLAAHPGASAATLTAELDAALRDVTLNFASDARAERAVTLARALAAIAEAPPSLAQPRELAAEAAIAQRVERATDMVAQAPPALAGQADRFVARVAALEARLAERGATLSDVRVSPRLRHGARFVARELSLAALALPIALLGRVTHWLPLRLARTAAMRPLADDPSRDQPAMRTIVLGLVTVLVWYALQFAVVARWLGVLAALLWLAAIALAARIDFLFADRLHRARERARTYLALRRDPALRERVLAEVDALLEEAVALERALIGS